VSEAGLRAAIAMTAALADLFHPDAARILDALRKRTRYRYVQPLVLREGDGWCVVSPCCSRNVDPDGGMIRIAWLNPVADGWQLHSQDHAAQRWALQDRAATLEPLLDLLCRDPQRVFWP
jgi:hypothetical protein